MLAVRQFIPGPGGGVCENARRASEANCRRHITITMPVAFTTLTADDATYGEGSFWAYNNNWGKGSLVNGVDYTDSITANDSTFPNGTTMSWNWPAGVDIYSYQEIIFGNALMSWWARPNGVSGPTSAQQVKNFTSLTTQYSFSISGDPSQFDVIWNMFLSSQADVPSTKQFEITVAAHNPGWTKIDTYAFSSGGYDFYVVPNFTFRGQPPWTMIGIVPSGGGDVLSGTLDIRALFNALIAHGTITGNEYLSGVELGAEAQGGSGSLQINSLNYQWEP